MKHKKLFIVFVAILTGDLVEASLMGILLAAFLIRI